MLKRTREKIEKCKSKNLKSGKIKEDELEIYDTRLSDTEIIIKFQELIPILNQDGNKTVNARDLHSQLEVGKDFSTWIKDRIEKYGFVDGEDYSPILGSIQGRGQPKIEYQLSLDTAKEIAMVENNVRGRLVRKYFIAVEKVYKNREEWNYDRSGSLIGSKELQKALMRHHRELSIAKPSWAKNVHQAEFCMFNNIIIGMSASDYRKVMGLNKSDSIRNTFNEIQLEYVSELENYDADLILVQNIFDYNKRYEILDKKYKSIDKK